MYVVQQVSSRSTLLTCTFICVPDARYRKVLCCHEDAQSDSDPVKLAKVLISGKGSLGYVRSVNNENVGEIESRSFKVAQNHSLSIYIKYYVLIERIEFFLNSLITLNRSSIRALFYFYNYLIYDISLILALRNNWFQTSESCTC